VKRTAFLIAFNTTAAIAFVLIGCATPRLESISATRETRSNTHAVAGASSESARQIVITIRDSDAGVRSTPGSSARTYASSSVYQVSAYARRVVSGLERDYDISWIAGWRIDLLRVHCAIFLAQDASSRDALLARLRADPRVESAQPMNEFTTSSRSTEYNDPYFGLQRAVEKMHVPEAHRWSYGRGVSIAVIDTGVDTSHIELAGRVRVARNFVDNDDQQFRQDRHGTAVAGVIAALVNNGEGIVGIAPSAELFALKACWHQRVASGAVCNTLTLAEALAFAIERRVQIINLSLTGPSDPLLARLLARAIEQGALVVGASAGGAGAGDKGFPLGVPGVIAVADADDGAGSDSQLAAPGREVLTLAPGDRYDYVSGASISAAMVSGVVALLLERGGHLQSTEVLALLNRTSSSAEDTMRLVDACFAVASLVQAATCGVTGMPAVAER